jgi:hypothetical protein
MWESWPFQAVAVVALCGVTILMAIAVLAALGALAWRIIAAEREARRPPVALAARQRGRP